MKTPASIYKNKKFHNLNSQELEKSKSSFFKNLAILSRYITEKRVDVNPQQAIPVEALTPSKLEQLSSSQLHVIKLGHSSLLLKVYGEYWLLDPVFSKRASPFPFLGPKRFHPAPIDIEALPEIDKVLISHDHYDHLDKQAIRALAHKTKQFLVPMGIDLRLYEWGVEEEQVYYFDWWEELAIDNGFIAYTPAQHFSGRGLGDGNKTLWGSWVIKAGEHSVFFSGDSGYFSGFKDIGAKYGPFDLTLIETGAYDKDWPDVHMQPEESLQAHLDVNGKVMMPVHNGTFDLAFHPWYEPLDRIHRLAQEQQVDLLMPKFGQVITLGTDNLTSAWWESLKQK